MKYEQRSMKVISRRGMTQSLNRLKEMLRTPRGRGDLCLTLALFTLPMGTSPFTILGLLAFANILTDKEACRDLWNTIRRPWMLPVLAWIVLVWIGFLYSPDMSGIGKKYAFKTHYWIYCLVAALVVSYRGFSPERMIHALLAGLATNAAIAIFQLLGVVPTRMMGKYFGLASGYNSLSSLLIIGMLVAAFYFKRASSPGRGAGWIALLLLFFFNLIIIRGRAGYVIFGLLSPIALYYLCKGRHLLVGFLIYLLTIVLMSYSPFVQERAMETIEDIRLRLRADRDVALGKKYSDLGERVYMWYWASHLFFENPLAGVGTGGYRKAMLEAGADVGVNHPHNNFLHMAVSHGIAGVSILLWFFFVLLRSGWYNRGSPGGFFVLSGGLVIFVGGFLNSNIIDANTAFLLAVLTGLQAGLSSQKRRSMQR